VKTRIRIDLAYDGSGFSGWAKQPQRPSIEASIEAAVGTVLRTDSSQFSIVVAGRTDAGVHAVGQVCHIDLPETVKLPSDADGFTKLARRLNGALASSGRIVIRQIGLAPAGFDARFSPLARHYTYRIADGLALRDPRHRHYTVWLDDPVDIDAMNTLSSALQGLSDWASFCRARVGATTIRDLHHFSWFRDDDGVLVGSVSADAFCHSMVRSLVGAAVAVGRGRCQMKDVLDVRESGQRTSLWKTMPAHGLTLTRVEYPPDTELAARQRETRGRRRLDSD
jgi:tRNA pseudouridine38-40 synthase